MIKKWINRMFGGRPQPPEAAQRETLQAEIEVTHFRVTKYDGDPPKPDENKMPVEIIQGGAGIPTRVWRRIDGKMVEVTDNDPG